MTIYWTNMVHVDVSPRIHTLIPQWRKHGMLWVIWHHASPQKWQSALSIKLYASFLYTELVKHNGYSTKLMCTVAHYTSFAQSACLAALCCDFSVNLFWPSDAIWRQRSGSTLAQVMACCLMAPSHYLNQCWLPSDIHIRAISKICLKITYLKFHSNFPGANELILPISIDTFTIWT